MCNSNTGIISVNEVKLAPDDAWISNIVDLCFDFKERRKGYPGGAYLQFRDDLMGTKENPGDIVLEFRKTYSENGVGDTEYHKIISLYIRSLIKHLPFRLDVPPVLQRKVIEFHPEIASANEYFAVRFLEVSLRAWNADSYGQLTLPRGVEDKVIALLSRYKANIKKFDLPSFSHTVSRIEQEYFRHVM